ncbi:MAG: ABC transporter substrate-binding protein [Chloroflexota bacterium]|nr:ABC transporter substrate-binding protein [Chloroflexota bacterium]
MATLSAAAVGLLAAACGANQAIELPTATSAPPGGAGTTPTTAAGQPTAAAGQPTAAAAQPTTPPPPAQVAQVPRNQTLIVSVSDTINQMDDVELQNPFLQGARRTGWHFSFEPFYFYDSVWNEKVSAPPGLKGERGEIPYQAESYQYNADYTELTIKLRPNVTWSDGTPFTTKDVVFTINMLKDNAPKLNFSGAMKLWVKDVVAVDPLTVKLTLTEPNPQFMFSYFQWYQDQGFPIVPEHIFAGQDPLSFTNYDLAKGWPITTGPWKLVYSSPEQKIWDRRDDWWGAKTGFRKLPAMKRVLVLPHYEDPKLTQMLSAGEVDCTHNIFAADTEVALARNKKLEVFVSSKKPPYGAIDGWTNALSFNCSKPPYDDREIRWAINYAMNRKQIIEVGFKGAGEYTVLPFPAYPTYKQYFDAVQDLLQKNPIDVYDPSKTAEIMQRKGWRKDAEGFWAKDGQRFTMVISNPPGFFHNFVPVIVAQFRQAGFDASFKHPTNHGTLVATGEADIFLGGHQGGVRDPYLTLNQYHGRYAVPNGEAAQFPYRWKNEQFDRIVSELGRTALGTPRYMDLYHQAMAVWIPELPDLPTVQWYQICPVNTQHWKGWPNDQNPYTTPASWHRGAATLFIGALEPA